MKATPMIDRWATDEAWENMFQTEPAELGGPGSGNKGHAGIFGHRGGSKPTAEHPADWQERFNKATRLFKTMTASGWGDKHKSLMPDDVTAEEAKALELYKNYTTTSKDINRFLRFGETPNPQDRIITPLDSADIQENAGLMESAISKTSVPEDLIVYRALHGQRIIEQMKSLPIGGEFIDHGFASTTLSKQLSYQYAEQADDIMNILLPEGSHAIFLDGNRRFESNYPGEVELLLARNSRFRLLGRERLGEGTPTPHWEYDVAMVGQE